MIDLSGEDDIVAARANEDLPSMHSRAGKVTHYLPVLISETEHYDETSGLILAEKASSTTADNHNGQLVLISFHVNSRPVARTAADKDLSAAHCVACRVADAAMHNYCAVIHCVSNCVLGIAVDLNTRAVKVRTQSISGYSIYTYISLAQAGSKESVSETVLNLNIAAVLFKNRVYLRVAQLLCIYYNL